MLRPNRNRRNPSAKNLLSHGAIWLGGMTLGVTCCLTSTAQLAVNQGFDGTSQNPAFNPRSQESSILIRDEAPARPTIVQPVQPSFNIRPQEQTEPLQPRVAPAGFEIPSSPTREDFTNPNTGTNTDGVAHASLSDGSAAVGTFAHESREPADRFAAPQPPSAPIRSFGSTSVPVQVAQTPRPDHEAPPIVQNDLRSSSTTPSSNERATTQFDRPAQPQFDSMTASPSFVDTRPAPPAAMPGSSASFGSNTSVGSNAASGRLNPQIFSQTQTPNQPNAFAQPAPQLNREPAPQLNLEPAATIDNNVAATSFSQAISDNSGETGDLAQTIVDRYSMDNTTEPLPGEPMTLTELLQQPMPIQNRPAMVSQYWETWFDWASMQNAIAYQEWLASVPNASAQGEQGLLDAARSAAENQVLAAKIQLGKSQAKLVRFMPTRRSSLSPLPSDSPLVERYETHYEIYRSRNLLPAKLVGIDQMLPQTLTLINNRAQTVQKSQAAIKQNLNGYSRRQVPLASVLETARVWRSSEQDLLASVTSYNKAIADYAFSIARQHTTPEQAVAMLIGKPKAKTAQPSAASRTASSSFGNNGGRNQNARNQNARNQNARNQNARSRNSTAASFGQPTNNRTAATTRNASSSSSDSLVASDEKLAPTNRPAWGGGNNNSTRQPAAVASRRSTADSSPSLGTNSRSPFGGTSSNVNSSRTASPPAFGASTTGTASQPSARPTRPATGGFGGQRNFGDRSASNTSNAFGGTSRTAASSGTPTTPAAATAPKRKPFPLPKRPSTNSFGFGS